MPEAELVFKSATPEEVANRFWPAIIEDLKAIELGLRKNREEITTHLRPAREDEQTEIVIIVEAIRRQLNVIGKSIRGP